MLQVCMCLCPWKTTFSHTACEMSLLVWDSRKRGQFYIFSGHRHFLFSCFVIHCIKSWVQIENWWDMDSLLKICHCFIEMNVFVIVLCLNVLGLPSCLNTTVFTPIQVLMLIDASFGFEMETFEFLNICQVHGFPRIMGVLTHLDSFKNNKTLRKTKKRLKHRFWTEVYQVRWQNDTMRLQSSWQAAASSWSWSSACDGTFQGAKLFYLSGMVYSEYQTQEVKNLGRFISVMKFRPLVWQTSHPYVVADRWGATLH